MKMAIQAIQSPQRTCPHVASRFVRKKFKTMLSLAAISMEATKRILSPGNWLFESAHTFEWTVHSLHLLADTAAAGPALSRAVHSIRHVVREVFEHGESGITHNFRKIRKIAFETFSLAGDICQIVVSLNKLGIIKAVQHVPGLQVAASIIASVASVVRISNAVNNKKFTTNEKMVIVAKEIMNIALSVLLVVAIVTQPHIILPLIIGSSFLFLSLDLLEYAFVKKEKEALYNKPDPAVRRPMRKG